LQTNNPVPYLRILNAASVILLFIIVSFQQPYGILQQEQLRAQQQTEQETSQKVPLGAASGSNFTNYTSPQFGFSLLYPSGWVNEEIPPGANLTFLMSFNPPPSEFGEFVTTYMAVKNLTGNNTSLEKFTVQEISLLKSPPVVTATADSSARTILESEPITIAGNILAHKIVYTEKISGALSKIMEIYIVNGKTGYIFTYLANTDSHDKYLPLVQRMVDSLNVTTSSNR
jgi:eukaryotic-like serine/threonine-protein kinase